MEKFKVGDKVSLKSVRKLPQEIHNWICLEESKPKTGDIFEVKEVTLDGYLLFSNLKYAHPNQKFTKKIDQS